jgi:hypothetical protein
MPLSRGFSSHRLIAGPAQINKQKKKTIDSILKTKSLGGLNNRVSSPNDWRRFEFSGLLGTWVILRLVGLGWYEVQTPQTPLLNFVTTIYHI